MSHTPSPGPAPSGPANRAYLDAMQRWTDLVSELSVLHARLEYVRLMLRLGVSPGAARRR